MSRIDQLSDRNHAEFHRYTKLYDLPDFVKQADLTQTGLSVPGMDWERLPVSAYADVRNPPQFPCHTKAATYVSWLYFVNHRNELAEKVASLIEQRLQKMAEYHRIVLDVAGLRDKHAQLTELQRDPELPDSAFAMVVTAADGTKDRSLPLRNAKEVKAAAEWFVESRDYYPFEWRQVIAKKILEKAAEFGASVAGHDDLLERQAGRGICRPKEAASLIRDRVRVARVPADIKEQFHKLAEYVADSPSAILDHETLSDLAKTIDQFDRAYGVKISAQTPRVEDVLFQVTYKDASDFTAHAVSTQSGSIYDRRDFEKVSLDDLRSLFGEEFASSVSTGLQVDPVKLAEQASTLPRPDAQLLDQLLSEHSVLPVTKQAMATELFDQKALQKMAEFYGD